MKSMKLIALMLANIVLFGSFASLSAVEYNDEKTDNISISLTESRYGSYSSYKEKYGTEIYTGEKIEISNSNINFSNDSTAYLYDKDNNENIVYWEYGDGSLSWEVDIKENGLYNFGISYLPLKSDTSIRLGIAIDNIVPFDGAEALEFSNEWVNATQEPRKDKQGNEIAPEQVISEKDVNLLAKDKTGVVTDPYMFYFSTGKHNITLKGEGYGIIIKNISLSAPETIQNYSSVSKNYNFNMSEAKTSIVIQGESATIKNDNILIPMSTNGDAGMCPIDASLTKINYIGGTNWNKPGQIIEWSFKVEEAGYYKFGTRYKQNELVNGESWRWLKIDGQTPFEEARELRFKFGTGWNYYEFDNNTDAYYFWLDEGKHNISLEVTLGDLSHFAERLNDVISKLGDLYLQIVMITGEVPDTNRDYELFNQIPNFNTILTEIDTELGLLIEDAKASSDSNGNQYTAAIDNMRRVVTKMIESPYLAHIYVKDYYTNYTTLSSWLNEMKKMPLAIDEIRFVPYDEEFDWNRPDFLEKLWFSIKRLILTFVDDYANNADDENQKGIKLWVNWGRDQTSALDSLIRDSFTSNTGINVDVQIVNNSLINGLLSGDFPDVQLYLSRTDPVNFGMRGALTDLTQFEDCDEVLKRFQKGAEIPYRHNGALYALPDQQTFFCMFYRTDVFKELGLKVPTNWDEFLDCATEIQRYNMGVYVPYTQITTTTTVNAGIGNLNLFPTLVLQKNSSLYNESLNATDLDSSTNINVFENWTKMYSDYGYLKEADFYNRFRNGSMPLGIASYTTYMTLYSAAPEIQGRWAIECVPGTINGNDFVAGGGTGCGIVKESKNQKEAWEFLKWWTSTETQVRYSNNVESLLGMLGRIPTSNVEAFKQLSWNPKDLNKLIEQWEKVKELPEVPGGYYVTRSVDQAFWSVLNDNNNAKDSITKWSKVADNEIAEKIKEYS